MLIKYVSCFVSVAADTFIFLLMVLNEEFQSLWYEIAIRYAIFDDLSCRETFKRQIVHDGDVVERVGGEECERTVTGAVGKVHFGAPV